MKDTIDENNRLRNEQLGNRKVEELTKSPTSDDPRGRQRKVICLRLAFLYVRIFQVFASLSLSVLDVDPQSEIKFYDNIALKKNKPSC